MQFKNKTSIDIQNNTTNNRSNPKTENSNIPAYSSVKNPIQFTIAIVAINHKYAAYIIIVGEIKKHAKIAVQKF